MQDLLTGHAHLHDNNMNTLPSKGINCSLIVYCERDLPVIGSVLSFPENTMGLETGPGILCALSFGTAGMVSDFGKGGIISAFGDGGKIAPVCLAK